MRPEKSVVAYLKCGLVATVSKNPCRGEFTSPGEISVLKTTPKTGPVVSSVRIPHRTLSIVKSQSAGRKHNGKA